VIQPVQVGNNLHHAKTYEYAFEQEKITSITKSEQNGTTLKVVQKIEVSYY
jgi:hypothetical protein